MISLRIIAADMQKWVGSQTKLSSTSCGVRAVVPASYFHKVMFAGRLHMVISSLVDGGEVGQVRGLGGEG